MANALAFSTIYQTVCKAIGDASYVRADEVKAVCNMIYLNEICQCDDLHPLFWLLEVDDAKKSKAPVTAISAITKATPPVATSVAHGLITGDLITMYDILGMTELNYNTYHATRDSADTFSLQNLAKANVAGADYAAAGTTGKAHHRGTLLTSCRGVLSANWHGYPAMDPISPAELANETTWLDESTSDPMRCQHRQIYTAAGAQIDYLLWYQAASQALNLHIQYEIQPARLSADTDYPLLPPQFHDAIIAGAIMRLGENKVQVEAGVIWPTVYQSHIKAITAFNRQWWAKYKPSERSGLYLA